MQNPLDTASTPHTTAVKFLRLSPGASLPQRQTPGSAGMDLCACLEEPLLVPPGEMRMAPLGFAAEIPPGFAGFIFSRSGLGAKGLVVAQGVGIIDSDYRGEWMVPLRNLSPEPWTVSPGERVAQAVFLPVASAQFVEAESLSGSQRGEGGFGSTGK